MDNLASKIITTNPADELTIPARFRNTPDPRKSRGLENLRAFYVAIQIKSKKNSVCRQILISLYQRVESETSSAEEQLVRDKLLAFIHKGLGSVKKRPVLLYGNGFMPKKTFT